MQGKTCASFCALTTPHTHILEMDKSLFLILTPIVRGTLAEQADDLYRQLTQRMADEGCTLNSLLQARLYLSDAANQYAALKDTQLQQTLLRTGVLTYVEQPPLCGAKVALLLWFVGGKVEKRDIHFLPCEHGALLEADGLTYVMHSVRYDACFVEGDEGDLTYEAFERHMALLDELGMNLRDHCLRTWLFVRDVDRHYAGVVKARNAIFDREGLTADTHYIASTGIGGASEAREALVAVDFLSIKGLAENQIGYLHALDYLNPTHEYGVAFERGTWADLPTGRHFFVSGTASIDKHGECLHRGDVLTQAGRLFLNIEKLLESAGGSLSRVAYFIVYLRDVADYEAVNAYMHLRFPHTPFLITEARVCRPEWLIEAECVAL